MSGIDCQLIGLEVENLRGFKQTSISLERGMSLLVGPNNSGKTSLLRLLDWAMNGATEDLFLSRREMTAEEESLLLPARDTRGAARRLVLDVRIADGRTARRFSAVERVARLRFRVIGKAVYLAVSPPRRSEARSSELAAIELLGSLREVAPVVLVPSARSAESDRFASTLTAAIRARLAERALHTRRGGAPAEYRAVKAALEGLETIASDLVAPLWSQMESALVPGLARVGDFSLRADPESLVDWLVSRIEFTLSTGEHDERRVRPSEVGSGLQSLLDVAVMRSAETAGSMAWLLIEEPEAFLHPSAQRSVAGVLRAATTVRRIVSTHSPLVAEEGEYGEIILVRDHKVFEPAVVNERLGEINTAFQTGPGAEALFARSILLVEGPGDRAYFEALRRRLAKSDASGRVNTLMVVDVGGKARFGPWIRLFRSYMSEGELPVRWIAVADSVDGAADLARGARDAGVVLPAPVAAAFRRIAPLFRDGQQDEAIEASMALNRAALATNARVALAPVDLEYLMLVDASPRTCRQISRHAGMEPMNRDSLLRRLGSRYGIGPSHEALKHPWIRSAIGRMLPPSEVSDATRLILRMWLGGAIEDDEEVGNLLNVFE